MSRRTVIILGVLAVVWGVPRTLAVYTDWLWFADLGFETVFRTRLLTQGALFILGGVTSFGVLLGSVKLAWRLGDQAMGGLEFPGSTQVRSVEGFLTKVVTGFAAFVALLVAGSSATAWDTLLRFLRPTTFEAVDPLFGRDVSFFVFTLPFYRFVQGWLLTAVGLALVVAAAVYVFKTILPQMPPPTDADQGPRPGPGVRPILTAPMRIHLFGLGAALLGLLAWGYRLRILELVYSTRGAAFGAGYTDVHARIPALWVLIGITLAAAAALLAAIRRPGLRLPAIAAGGWVVMSILVGTIYPVMVQRLVVQPQELERERPYLERSIRMTRQAFALDRIQEVPVAGEEMVTPEEITDNPGTIGNIRLWDPEPLLTTYNQIQSIRAYYEFVGIDVDRYTIDGQYRQVMLSARELAPERLPSQAQTWVNRRLQFTHGYGAAMSAVNEVTPEGLPTLFLQDVPPRGKVPISRPELYFSEKSADYVIVRTRFSEFSYPRGDDNVYTTYQGETGVRIGSVLRQLLFAWRFRDLNILLSDAITPESTILYHRRITERVTRVAPFLKLDADPYIVVADGRMFWIIDAYTRTDRYPYAQPYMGVNYIRNSVKFVVDAYHGTVALYVADPTDPLIRTYDRIFPGLLRPLETMPAALRGHVRYPQDLFAIQAEMYRVFHMQDPRVFYNKEDVWILPQEIYIDRPRQMAPYYIIMRLSEMAREEFALILPYTPPGKQNMITWLAARSDGEDYGKLLAFRYSKDKLVFGPMQIEARINQNPVISEQFTLWSQGGNRVIRGAMIVIPVGQSNLYVEPVYLQAEQGRLPEMRRVVLAAGNRIMMESTVDAALRALFAGPVERRPPAVPGAPPAGPSPPDLEVLLRSLQARHSRLSQDLEALEVDLQRLITLLREGRQ